MAKRRKQTPQRSHVYQSGETRPGFSRKQPPASEKSGPNWVLLAVGAVGVVAVIGVLAYALGFFKPGPAASPSPTAAAIATPRPSFDVQPPSATPLASPPASPSGDGTTATIETDLGNITFEIFTDSSPVAAENFINLAEAGFYNGVGFHRIIPDFMIQGGDPDGDGSGGPGYSIADEPIVGDYNRGMVAMARTSQPHSEGSQFFIMVKDTPQLNGGGYAIFGRVTSGLEVADQISVMPNAGDQAGNAAIDPVIMNRVTIQRP